MSVKSWNTQFGLFSSPYNALPSAAPEAGDNLYIRSGAAILFNQTFGSASNDSSIGLIGDAGGSVPQLVLWNAVLKNVIVDNAPPAYTGPENQRPADYYAGRYGRVVVAGVVTNQDGAVYAGRFGRPEGDSVLDIAIAPGSTLVNKGVLNANPKSMMNIVGYGGSTLENDQSISASGGTLTISAHLTGTGDVYASTALGGSASGSIELNAAVDAGQTFHLSRAVLQVDQPLAFLGQIDANPQQLGARVTLEGLAATSWDVNGSTVELLNASGGVIDTLRFTTPQDATTLQVYVAPDATYGSAVSVVTGPIFSPPPSGTLLPIHTAVTV